MKKKQACVLKTFSNKYFLPLPKENAIITQTLLYAPCAVN